MSENQTWLKLIFQNIYIGRSTKALTLTQILTVVASRNEWVVSTFLIILKDNFQKNHQCIWLIYIICEKFQLKQKSWHIWYCLRWGWAMRCSHLFSTVCLYWANSHEVHKSKMDSWVTAVIVGAVANKGDQPSPKSYDNSNARLSFHEMCNCLLP